MTGDFDQPNAGITGRLQTVADLLEIAGRMTPSTVVVAGGDRVEELRLVESARDHGIVDRIILVGRKKRIRRAVAEVGIEVPDKDIIPADDDEQAAATMVELVKAGGIDVALKGSVPSHIINRHMLPLAVRPTVSLTAIFDAAPIADGRPMVMTDAGVTTVCNFGRMVDLIRNAVDVAHVVMGIERPRVAVLSANEKQLPSLPSTWMGAALTSRHWPDAVVYGPLSLDLATDPDSVAAKGLPDLPAAHEVAGRADVLVCPNIDAANVLYKAVAAMAKYGQASIACLTTGFSVAFTLLSRSGTLESRLESIALCSIYAQRALRPQAQPTHTRIPAKPKTYRVVAVNPGSTSMKVSLYANEDCAHEAEVAYAAPALATPAERRSQVQHLTELVRETLGQWRSGDVDAVAARGGFLPRPPGKLSGGTYVVADLRDDRLVVDEAMVSAVLDHPARDHPCNLGAPIAAALARHLRVPAFVVDPVVVDEFSPEAEISGYRPIVRRSASHALSVREAMRRAARAIGRPPEDINLVVAHLGGGITVTAVRRGKMVDSNISLLGGGPFTPQRVGQLPMGELIDLCYSGRITREALIQDLTRRGGLQSYLGEYRMPEIEQRIAAGDEQARLVVDAMVYQIANEIGKMFVAAGCDVEAIVLTGGLIRSKLVRTALRRRVNKLAPVMVFEEPLEMAALAAGVIEVLSGRERAHHYELPNSFSEPGDPRHE